MLVENQAESQNGTDASEDSKQASGVTKKYNGHVSFKPSAPPPPKAETKLRSKIPISPRKSSVVQTRRSVGHKFLDGKAADKTGVVAVEPNDGYYKDPSLDIPPSADTMKLAAGVTLREGDVVRKGPVIPRKPKDNASKSIHVSESRSNHFHAKKDPLLEQVISKAKPKINLTPAV